MFDDDAEDEEVRAELDAAEFEAEIDAEVASISEALEHGRWLLVRTPVGANPTVFGPYVDPAEAFHASDDLHRKEAAKYPGVLRLLLDQTKVEVYPLVRHDEQQ